MKRRGKSGRVGGGGGGRDEEEEEEEEDGGGKRKKEVEERILVNISSPHSGWTVCTPRDVTLSIATYSRQTPWKNSNQPAESSFPGALGLHSEKPHRRIRQTFYCSGLWSRCIDLKLPVVQLKTGPRVQPGSSGFARMRSMSKVLQKQDPRLKEQEAFAKLPRTLSTRIVTTSIHPMHVAIAHTLIANFSFLSCS